jgi:hypothetical protein
LSILDPDVKSFSHDLLVGIGVFYCATKSHILNRSRVVKWLMVIQEHFQDFNKYTAYKYIQIIAKHKSTTFVSYVLLDLGVELLFKAGHSAIF